MSKLLNRCGVDADEPMTVFAHCLFLWELSVGSDGLNNIAMVYPVELLSEFCDR